MGSLSDFIQNGRLSVKVTPKASRNTIQIDGNIVRVYVTAAPDKGKANKAVIDLVSKIINVPKSSINVIKGASGRDKVLAIMDD